MTAAILVAIALLLALAWRWRPRQPLERGTAWLLVSYAALGACAAILSLGPPSWQPVWLRYLEPSVMYGTLAAVLLIAQVKSAGYPVKAILGSQFVLSRREWELANMAVGVGCLLLAVINLVVVITLEPDDWEGFKWSYMANLFAAFFLRASFVWVDLIFRTGQALHGRWKARGSQAGGQP